MAGSAGEYAMRSLLLVAILILQPCLMDVAVAQTFQNLTIDVEGLTSVMAREEPNVSVPSGAVTLGRTTTVAIGYLLERCGFAVQSAGPIEPPALAGWVVVLTPTKVVGDEVTFRARWTRGGALEEKWLGTRMEEITLRAGEVRPLDSFIPFSPAVGRAVRERCHASSTTLQLRVTALPRPQKDSRVFVTDLWLVDRLPSGAEKTELVSVRGRLNEATPFYFETLTDGDAAIEFLGQFTAALEGGTVVMNLDIYRDLAVRVGGGGRGTGGKNATTIRLEPDSVVAIELPRSADEIMGFANHAFSIRIRTRELRFGSAYGAVFR